MEQNAVAAALKLTGKLLDVVSESKSNLTKVKGAVDKLQLVLSTKESPDAKVYELIKMLPKMLGVEANLLRHKAEALDSAVDAIEKALESSSSAEASQEALASRRSDDKA